MKKIPTPKSGDEGVSPHDHSLYTTWPYFKSLLFLKDQMKPRKLTGSLNMHIPKENALQENNIQVNDSDEDILEVSLNGNVNLFSESQNFKTFEVDIVEPKKKKQKKVSNTTINSGELLSIEKRKLELLEQKIETNKKRDDDEAFFDSLVPYMKNMDMAEKLKCRMEIQNIVFKHAFPENPIDSSFDTDQFITMSP